MDERDHGNMADRVRGRVVYRGYIPRNTYYYFKTIKGTNKEIKTSNTAPPPKKKITEAKIWSLTANSKAVTSTQL